MAPSRLQKVIVGLSGGVDSAVTAWLLQQQGFDVRAVFMLNWSEKGEGCNWEWDFESAKMVARHLEIPLMLWNFEEIYRQKVYDPFIASYARGNTPNPDVVCNQIVKFGAFLDTARTAGADWVATGHYARIRPDVRAYGPRPVHNTRNEYSPSLVSGIDRSKDQSYFLATLTRPQLHDVLFPLGGLEKRDVRHIARSIRLPNADRRDSYGICFIGERPFAEFVRTRVRCVKGPMMTVEGEQVGEHEGLQLYTIGQRKGIGIGGRGPFYVVEKRMEDNALIVGQGSDHPSLYTDRAVLSAIHWIQGTPPSLPMRVVVRHRHLQPLQEAVITYEHDGYVVQFAVAQRAVTPGQFLAVYKGEECLGGGVIEKSKIPISKSKINPNTQ